MPCAILTETAAGGETHVDRGRACLRRPGVPGHRTHHRAGAGLAGAPARRQPAHRRDAHLWPHRSARRGLRPAAAHPGRLAGPARSADRGDGVRPLGLAGPALAGGVRPHQLGSHGAHLPAGADVGAAEPERGGGLRRAGGPPDGAQGQDPAGDAVLERNGVSRHPALSAYLPGAAAGAPRYRDGSPQCLQSLQDLAHGGDDRRHLVLWSLRGAPARHPLRAGAHQHAGGARLLHRPHPAICPPQQGAGRAGAAAGHRHSAGGSHHVGSGCWHWC